MNAYFPNKAKKISIDNGGYFDKIIGLDEISGLMDYWSKKRSVKRILRDKKKNSFTWSDAAVIHKQDVKLFYQAREMFNKLLISEYLKRVHRNITLPDGYMEFYAGSLSGTKFVWLEVSNKDDHKIFYFRIDLERKRWETPKYYYQSDFVISLNGVTLFEDLRLLMSFVAYEYLISDEQNNQDPNNVLLNEYKMNLDKVTNELETNRLVQVDK
jgi:hypothetical protein